MMRDKTAVARIKRLVIYFPDYPQPYSIKVSQLGGREDLAVATFDPASSSRGPAGAAARNRRECRDDRQNRRHNGLPERT